MARCEAEHLAMLHAKLAECGVRVLCRGKLKSNSEW